MPRPTGSRQITKNCGPYSWSSERLHSKIKPEPGCYQWLGSANINGNLFLAYKNDRAYNANANRLIWMDTYGEDIRDYRVAMSCQNKYCCNVDHMTLEPNYRRYKGDGKSPCRNPIYDKD